MFPATPHPTIGTMPIDPTATRTCRRCLTPYAWRRSRSALRMTYCSVTCEIGDTGWSIDAVIAGQYTHMRRPSEVLVSL